MKSIKKLFFSCALSLLMWQAYAQSPVTVFSGSSLPTAQGWTELKLDNTVSSAAVAVSSSVSNNALNIASTNAANQFSQLGWYKTGLNLNPQTGYTIEIKAKVTTADKTGAFNIQGFDAAGKGFRLGILNNAITELTNPLAATKTLAGGLTNDDDFHIYKLAVTAATVAVFRDGTLVGTFPLADFYWDNIIENGGFEDVDVPDFSSNGILARTNAVGEAYTGNYGFIINSDGRNQETDPKEMATTRAYPVKPGADYEFSLIARRLIFDNEWAWRDLGGYYDTQAGTLAGSKDPNVFWWNNPFENTSWKKQLSPFTPDAGKASIRFESPSWTKDGTKQTSKVGFDNVYLREKLPVTLGPTLPAVTGFVAPVIPDGVTNLIYNGDFENETMNNDGTEYIWALSNSPADQENTPVADNPIWGNNVRLQRNEKTSDNVGGDGGYAHSGTHSVRFSSLDINAKNVDFHVELEANKTYRFVFWHRNPGYNDWAWFFVRIGEQSPMWGHKVGSYANKWIPVDLTFTTTAEHKTLHLYSTSATHGGWYNQYFDDFTLYELTGDVADPQIAGKANLIENGDFEDVTKNNDGTNYAWALASAVTGSNDDNLPLAKNDLWGTYVRIQDKEKRAGNVNYTDWNVSDDTGLQWAHSGTKSLRFTTQSNGNPADAPIGLNLDFQKELEPNKTYTFVFWIKTAYFDDNGGGGALHIANDSQELMSQVLTNKWMNWTRQSVTFSTTAQNHTLRLYSDFSGWVNFYLDDLFLFEETNVSPPAYDGESFLFFGKSTSAYSANVDVEYVKVDNTGAYINTVEFNSNGGSTVDTQIVSGAATEPAVPTKTGYTFGGWYSDMAFTTPYDFATIVSSNIILYAKWTINSYTLTFESNGGSSVAPQTLEYNLKFTTPATPVKASHDFKGWYIDNETFATPYNFNTLATTNLTVYSKWELHELVLYLPFEDDLNDATSYARNPTAPNGNDFAEGVKGKALSLNQEDLTTGNQHLDWSFPNVINPAETPHSFSMWF
ncbi:MAG: InlB B-repeat-containing protein, partial [Dysgonamonadaceae bacterium]|nr:InlB B-repeat-containing protein [Dysgonamonadaceae bacterium]